MIRCLLSCVCLSLLSSSALAADDAPPAVGETAPDFELQTVGGETIKLSKLTDERKVVLIVLRGFPGYQCPICRRQVSAFQNEAEAFRKAGASVVMVYPGDVADLNVKALEFLGKQKLPADYHVVLDPGYKFTDAWHLRWDAERETAYPSTFVIDRDRKVTYAKISKTHGGRANPGEILLTLEK
jgi:thioredoxin-dependent peroxiredoxin